MSAHWDLNISAGSLRAVDDGAADSSTHGERARGWMGTYVVVCLALKKRRSDPNKQHSHAVAVLLPAQPFS
jgi:hypothetical protein